MLDIENSIITLDTMGCHRKIDSGHGRIDTRTRQQMLVDKD